ncbi:MAG TPA: helicase-exonuclease AddAB subunit AddB [Clostridiales bacterium]|nr:helicase-exonuclease AddAB subunit AddB [Clostridiales bacterium]
MSLQLILGSSGAGKSHQLYQDIIDKATKETDNNYLVIVPEQFTLQTQKDIVTIHPNKAIMNVDILSFQRFAFRVFDEIGGENFPILDDTGKSMIIRKVIADKKNELTLFANNTKKVGFINELKSILSEFYQYSIGVEDIEKMKEVSKDKPVLKAKLNDIITVYNAFDNFIQDKYITAEEILEVLYKVIDDSNWINNSIIYLDGFTGFTPVQYKVLGKVMKNAKEVYITLTIDPREDISDSNYDYNLFGISQKTIMHLKEIACQVEVDFEEPIYAEEKNKNEVYRFKNSLSLASLEKNIFRYPYKVFDDEQGDIRIFECRDNTGEIEFVVKEIKRLVREEGYRYRDIAVVTADIEQYGLIASRKFAQNKIPCFVDYKRDMLNNPYVELLRSLVDIIVNNFNYESVFRYLRTGLSTLTREEVDCLENYVIAKGVRGYRRYNEAFTRVYKSNEAIKTAEINIIREKFVIEIEEIYQAFKNKDNYIKDYVMALYEHSNRLNIENKLIESADCFRGKNLFIEAKEYEQIYEIVLEFFKQINLLLADEKATIKEFGEILEAGLAEARVGVIPPGVDEVVVGDTHRTRLKDIKALFFIGVNDGMVPKAGASGGILSDIDRELLLENDFQIAPTAKLNAFIEQFYIYLNLTKANDKLYLTYHNLNEEGKTSRPSYLISKLKLIFPKLKVEYDNQDDINTVLNDKGLKYLGDALRKYPSQDLTDLWKEIYIFYQASEEDKELLNKLINGTFDRQTNHKLSEKVAQQLYGKELLGSVTRLEKYESCSFAHFLTYGLQLRERAEFKLAIPDIGNIFHNAIDSFSKKLGSSNYTWHDIPDNTREEWANEIVIKVVEDYENSFIKSSKRNEYIIERVKRITVRTLWALCNQIRQGAFEPYGYELAFEHSLNNKETLLRGRIDRVDIYEEDNKIYVRVIDYKSGKSSFNFEKIYYGLQQQLSIYLKATMQVLSESNPNKEVVPAGILYYNIDDPIVDKTDKYLEEIYKELKMDGLINKESNVLQAMDKEFKDANGAIKASVKSNIIPVSTNKDSSLSKSSNVARQEQINNMLKFVEDKLEKSSKEILEGQVSLNPYEMKDNKACDYCLYKSVCGFDRRLPEHKFRKIGDVETETIMNELFGEKEEKELS